MDPDTDDEAPLDEEEGTPRITCPICGAQGFIGEAACPHWFAGDGMDAQLIGGVGALLDYELEERLAAIDPVELEEMLADAPPDVGRALRVLLAEDERWWWQEEPGVERSDKVEVDEASGTWAYWDWFHRDPDFRNKAAALAARAQEWVEAFVARRAR